MRYAEARRVSTADLEVIGWIRRIRPIGPLYPITPISAVLLALCVLLALPLRAEATSATASALSPRTSETLTTGWRTAHIAHPALLAPPAADDPSWRTVEVPHNWDDYGGATGVRHGNLHGSAWYQRTFAVEPAALSPERRVFLFFEGVGSYATVWVNGREVGKHAGGLTTFTLDVTAAVHAGDDNGLLVRADHPEGIRDLPWVCGGCERVYGFSEGPQPFGIFRPVHVVVTNAVRVAPFGVHVWNDAEINPAAATIHTRTEIRNHRDAPASITLVANVRPVAPERGSAPNLAEAKHSLAVTLAAGETRTVAIDPLIVADARLWSLNDPYRYCLVTELIDAGGHVLDREETLFGIRTIRWPDPKDPNADGRFFLNGEPVFLNGTCDYEHNLGANFAFTNEQIAARVSQIRAAGFNAFRDAHHPHNLRFQEHWDREGVAWWTQMGAQIWFDSDAFRENFRTLLRQWVKERRNSPSLVLWGLQNESKLPEAFAAECTAIIRELDPTSPSQRLVTTCNGGKGTDWDVPQNWTGTYGGDPALYADDLKRQRLIGEYGAWRSLGLHSEGGFDPKGPLSEDRFSALLGTKLRLARNARDFSAGHFQWPLTTHANPGRAVGENGEQLWDGYDELDRVGPANNKGLFTQWGEPTDAFYLYRAAELAGPVAYIVSPTWSDRWKKPEGISTLTIFTNCNLGRFVNDTSGTADAMFRRELDSPWVVTVDASLVRENILHVDAFYQFGGEVHHTIVLDYLPHAPNFTAARAMEINTVTTSQHGRAYLYRVNCGGGDYTDTHGQLWSADRTLDSANTTPSAKTSAPGWYSTSWAGDYAHLDPRLGSQRRFNAPVVGTLDDVLFQTFRYGREKLRYLFPVAPGDYEVELYFAEPWYGQAGVDARGWRIFDVAVNGKTAVRDLDLVREAGFATAVKKVVPIRVSSNSGAVPTTIEISFPRIAAGQAVISAIAISHADDASAPRVTPALGIGIAATDPVAPRPPPAPQFAPRSEMLAGNPRAAVGGRLQIGMRLGEDDASRVGRLSVALADSDWLQPQGETPLGAVGFAVNSNVEVYAAFQGAAPPGWLAATPRISLADGTPLTLHKRRVASGARFELSADEGRPVKMLLVQAVRPAVICPLQPEPDGSPAWTIQVGVGDRYGLNFQYRNASGAPVKTTLAIVQADGTTLRTDPLEFPPSVSGDGSDSTAWSTLRARTGSSINAGTYRLVLRNSSAGLALGELEIE